MPPCNLQPRRASIRKLPCNAMLLQRIRDHMAVVSTHGSRVPWRRHMSTFSLVATTKANKASKRLDIASSAGPKSSSPTLHEAWRELARVSADPVFTEFEISCVLCNSRNKSFAVAVPSMRWSPSKNSSKVRVPSPLSNKLKISSQFAGSISRASKCIATSAFWKPAENSSWVRLPLPSVSIAVNNVQKRSMASFFILCFCFTTSSASFIEFVSALSTSTAVTMFMRTSTARAT
mmetsp:Transcript_31634/g.104831  ORF Transcript_31634/g.104831 Transcript_31634/m.104831 type:complete len:234 (-) Transcript_31634:893-1594(-)